MLANLVRNSGYRILVVLHETKSKLGSHVTWKLEHVTSVTVTHIATTKHPALFAPSHHPHIWWFLKICGLTGKTRKVAPSRSHPPTAGVSNLKKGFRDDWALNIGRV